jgi:ABC-type transport system involved in cytochrome c biogenesis permease subunit
MFFGGFWSYVGWGAPIHWQSRILLGMVGTWFYYSLYLHLHLNRRVSNTTVLYAACAGGLLSFFFTFLPDTGIFHFQGIIL